MNKVIARQQKEILEPILRSLFGIYALLFFSLALIPAFLSYVFIFTFYSGRHASVLAHRLSRLWAAILFRFYFIRVTICNRHYIDPETTYVFVANHRSMLDIPLYALSCRNTFRFLAKEELSRIPLLGYIIKKLYITVNRSDRNDRQRSMEIMNESLKERISVFICPEGTRNRSEHLPLLEFRDGAFRLAIYSGCPLAVLTVLNSGELLSPLRWLQLKPGHLQAIWSPPLQTTGLSENDIPVLKEKVRQLMLSHLNDYQKMTTASEK
jgi:1-acyl-sn-glycerol-3-phosphate acyltransferase